jgi:hypothetical protein
MYQDNKMDFTNSNAIGPSQQHPYNIYPSSTNQQQQQMYSGPDFKLRQQNTIIRKVSEDDEMLASTSLPHYGTTADLDDYDAFLEDATSIMATHAEGGSKLRDMLPTSEADLFDAFAAIQATDRAKTANDGFNTIKEEVPDSYDHYQTVEEYIRNRTVSPSAFFGARVIIPHDPDEFDVREGPPNVNLPVIANLDIKEDKKTFMEKVRTAMRITQLFPRRYEMDAAIAESQFIEEIETSDWCHIHYYEFGERVGEIFKAISPSVTIDGLCAPSDATRLCLGAVGNPNRDPVAVAARRQIGRGCKLIYSDGNVTIESMSDAAIFIQSPIHAKSRNDHLATVYRLPAGHRMEVFNNILFTQLLENARSSNDFNQIYYLQTMCHVRMSFVKGWGERYRRQQITSTPCWVELHLPDPLKAVDFALKQVLGPTNEVHSDT